MASQNGRTLDLDALFGPPLDLVFRGRTHRIPAEAFTMDLIMEVQKVMQDADVADEDAVQGFLDELQAVISRLLSHAKPKLELGALPPPVLSTLALEITAHAFGTTDAVPPTPPNRAARRATPAKARTGTRQTRK